MKNKFLNRHGCLLAGVSLAVLVPGVAAAQDANQSASPSELGEIVITATKQDTSLQDASLSATAVSAQTLAENNITDITGLNGSVPSLVVARSGGGERVINIRGIGSETPENTNSQPGVSYHVDGVYIFNSIAASAAFIDVGQVEILRGPQGTTFGQGSTGGTINVVSRQPVLGQFSVNGEAGVGNYNLLKASGGINIPVGDTLAFRFAAQQYSHDGYATATDVVGYGNYDLDDANEFGWKASMLWQPVDDLSITLTTIQYNSNTHGPAQKNILDPNSDTRELTQDFPSASVVDTELYYGVIAYDMGFATLKSTTSYQTMHSEQSWDADGLTAALFYDLTYNPLLWGGYTYDHVSAWTSDTESWTQEVNLTSNGDGPFQWIAGGVYLHSTNKQFVAEFRGTDNNLVPPVPSVDIPYNDPLVPSITYAELSSITRESWAAYFQGTYDFTPNLSLTAGLRYNHDQYNGTSASNNDGVTSGPLLQPQETEGLTTNEWTGKVALEYHLTASNMVYASYTRGFKPGGINSSAASGGSSYLALGWGTGIRPTYQPETVDSFEIGSKNRFFHDSVQFNVSAFYYDYTNMQFLDEDAILYGEGTANAPGAHIYGVELEGSWIINDHLKVEGSLSALRGKFDEDYYALDPVTAQDAQDAAGYPGWLFWSNFYNAALAREAVRENINGNEVPKLPGWQGTAALTYTNEVGPGRLTARAQYLYRGDFYYRVFNKDLYDLTPAYSTVNLYFRYDLESAPVYASFGITNLFNEDGVNSRFSDPYGSAQTFVTYIAPRQAIFSIGFNF